MSAADGIIACWSTGLGGMILSWSLGIEGGSRLGCVDYFCSAKCDVNVCGLIVEGIPDGLVCTPRVCCVSWDR